MAAKTPRNAPCPCGSGRKFKACCLPTSGSPSRLTLPQAVTNRLPATFRSAAPAPRKWNEVVFDAPLANDGRLHAVLLYSDAGLRLSPFRMGEVLTLDLPDIRFRGPATVVRVQPSRATARGEAEVLRVVRFRHDDDLGTVLHGERHPPPEFIERWRSRRREIALRLTYPNGEWCDVRLLRTVKWLDQIGARVGGKVFLDLSEVGTRGWAEVLEILPCGPVEVGSGEMVTGTFKHSHGTIGQLILESEPKPIGVTPGHLFWSVDRQAWVPVSGLRRGETLQTSAGVTRVVSYTLTDKVEPVYNLEVEHDHCYRVGESGILVHNMSANPNLNVITATASAFRAEDCGDPRFYIFATLGSGVLRFEVVARLASGGRGSVSGKEFFAAMMAHFGGKVRIIEGNWSRASGLMTNIDQLNRATAAGLKVKDAAPFTWTGLRASEYGYDKVTVIYEDPPGAQGNYDTIRVEFSR